MLTYPDIDPVALDLGLFQIHWYGISYVASIVIAWALLHYRTMRFPWSAWTDDQLSDLIFYGTIGMILGGRLGSVLFYNLSYYLANPVAIIKIWEGGMSFHGALLGVALALWLYSRKSDKNFFATTDFLVPVVPVGLFFGRIANFINAELWGAPSDLPWAMVFPGAGGIPRHPSQLYEAALEGIALFIILWLYSRKTRPTMAVSGLFLSGYGLFRSLVECVREPDQHIGYLAGDWLTMGQLLSLPMLIGGGVLLVLAYRR